MTIVICPGYHPPELTIDFLKGLGRDPGKTVRPDLIYPADRQPPYSSLHLLTFLRQSEQGQTEKSYQKLQSLLFIGFSAGVVAAIGAAHLWQADGGSVKAVIAIDGWGVPLWGNFPIHRLSHDAFTHWSSALLGGGEAGFYADPAVGHLDLWRSPQHVGGYWVQPARPVSSQNAVSLQSSDRYHRTTAAEWLNHWLIHYGEGRIT